MQTFVKIDFQRIEDKRQITILLNLFRSCHALDEPPAANKLPMVTNRLNSNYPNRKSLQLQCLDATALLMKAPPPIFDPFVASSATRMTILLVERNAYAALAIAGLAYVLETAGLV